MVILCRQLYVNKSKYKTGNVTVTALRQDKWYLTQFHCNLLNSARQVMIYNFPFEEGGLFI